MEEEFSVRIGHDNNILHNNVSGAAAVYGNGKLYDIIRSRDSGILRKGHPRKKKPVTTALNAGYRFQYVSAQSQQALNTQQV